MVIRRVAELGHPVLRQVAEPVPESELASRGLRALVADLVDTMRDYEGVGIAAPQVYVPQRVFVMEVRSPDPYLGASVLPLTVAVNPEVTLSGYAARIVQHELDHLDGCLYVDRSDSRSLCTNREYVRRRRAAG